RADKMMRTQDVECLETLQKKILVFPREFLDRYFLLAAAIDRLVVNVGHVHDLTHIISVILKRAPYKIIHDESPVVAYMGRIIGGRPAVVDGNSALAQGFKYLDFAGKRVMESDVHESCGTVSAPAISSGA